MTRGVPTLGAVGAACLLTAAALAAPAAAQTTFTVQGRVYATDTGEGIRNAVVSMEGSGSTLTSTSGGFRFQGVEPGEHDLRVEAFGYEDASRALTVDADTTVEVPLTPAPLSLDSLNVELETLDFDGRVVDPQKDLRLVDAEVLSSQGHEEWSDTHGNFDLDDVYQDVPLRIVIRSFGYLPLDTTFVPDGDGRHDFDMAVDSTVQRVIDMQVERIVDVIGGRRSVVTRPLDREGLLRFAGTFTVYDMILAQYGRQADRVGCLVVDEKQIPRVWNWKSYLTTMLPEDLERLEILDFGDGRMMRIYTRDFIQHMPIGRVELREPTYAAAFGEPFCT